jgi:hypothetical protein
MAFTVLVDPVSQAAKAPIFGLFKFSAVIGKNGFKKLGQV